MLVWSPSILVLIAPIILCGELYTQYPYVHMANWAPKLVPSYARISYAGGGWGWGCGVWDVGVGWGWGGGGHRVRQYIILRDCVAKVLIKMEKEQNRTKHSTVKHEMIPTNGEFLYYIQWICNEKNPDEFKDFNVLKETHTNELKSPLLDNFLEIIHELRYHNFNLCVPSELIEKNGSSWVSKWNVPQSSTHDTYLNTLTFSWQHCH